jgi:hypothetical protein
MQPSMSLPRSATSLRTCHALVADTIRDYIPFLLLLDKHVSASASQKIWKEVIIDSGVTSGQAWKNIPSYQEVQELSDRTMQKSLPG